MKSYFILRALVERIPRLAFGVILGRVQEHLCIGLLINHIVWILLIYRDCIFVNLLFLFNVIYFQVISTGAITTFSSSMFFNFEFRILEIYAKRILFLGMYRYLISHERRRPRHVFKKCLARLFWASGSTYFENDLFLFDVVIGKKCLAYCKISTIEHPLKRQEWLALVFYLKMHGSPSQYVFSLMFDRSLKRLRQSLNFAKFYFQW
jgi:hypothetical protein